MSKQREKWPKTRPLKKIFIYKRRQFLFGMAEGDARHGLVSTYTCSCVPGSDQPPFPNQTVISFPNLRYASHVPCDTRKNAKHKSNPLPFPVCFVCDVSGLHHCHSCQAKESACPAQCSVSDGGRHGWVQRSCGCRQEYGLVVEWLTVAAAAAFPRRVQSLITRPACDCSYRRGERSSLSHPVSPSCRSDCLIAAF